MSLNLKHVGTILIVAFLAVGAGCSSLPSGMSDADAQDMQDVLTAQKIQRAIYSNPQLTGERIFAGCVDGLVTLSGTVGSREQIALAERLALGVDGVTDVNNIITTESGS